ncbi:T9SS type A sorting domain-containing protein [Paraflavitalea soli]|nr:T9SS type A sorting domain-containing protein [Paraflavitalea soli]
MNRILASVVLFLGVQAICLGQDMMKVTSGAVVSVQNGVGLLVAGGIVLDNNSTFKNEGVVTIERKANTTADLTDNSTVAYQYGLGKFVFTGPGAQSLKSINQFERVEVDNMDLNLLSNINVNTWYLKTGKVNTGSFLAIVNNASASAVLADATNTGFTKSWINGVLRRYITPAAVDNYQFPVGDAAKVNLAEMDNLTANPITGVTYVTASFGAKAGNDVGLNVNESGNAYASINNTGVWHLVADANPAGGKYDLKLFFNGFAELADNGFGILRRPEASVNAIDWAAPSGSALPASGMPGRLVADKYARRNSLATFGQFAIGSTLTTLPLELLSFSAVKKGNTVVLKWTTDNEINTSHFELYRAGQSAPLQYLDKTTAAGSGARQDYSYTDRKPLKGVGFYQLKMVDKDLRYTLSKLVKVTVEEMTSFNVYPNPVTGNSLFVDYSGGKITSIKLIAMDGKQVACTYTNQSDRQIRISIPVLPAKGMYSLQLITEEGVRSAMVSIQ